MPLCVLASISKSACCPADTTRLAKPHFSTWTGGIWDRLYTVRSRPLDVKEQALRLQWSSSLRKQKKIWSRVSSDFNERHSDSNVESSRDRDTRSPTALPSAGAARLHDLLHRSARACLPLQRAGPREHRSG